MVLLHNVHKYFSANGIKALDGADFELREGEIHALVGENGAGKSTLMHIMAGFMKPDEGIIIADGREKSFSSPAKALAEGIGMVRQHPRLAGECTVWENIALGSETFPWLSRRRLLGEIALLDERWSFGLPLERPASELTVSQGQKTAILALLRRSARYLIFDEPTAVLSPPETEALFDLFKKLKDEGRGIVLISHKLDETLRLAGRVTVLGRGKTAAVLNSAEIEEGQLSALIFGEGRAGKTSGGAEQTPSKAGFSGTDMPPALELRDWTVNVPGRPLIRGISLEVERGRITGIAGVRDSGLETLELALTGYLPSSGTMIINGRKINNDFEGYGKNIKVFRDSGGSYLGTRETNAPEAALPLRDILVIHAHRRFGKFGFLNTWKLADWSRRIVKDAGLGGGKERPDAVPASAFSGGQFQRIIFSREIAEKSPLLVLAEPGRGLDRKSRDALAAILRERTAGGENGGKAGILIFSTDSEELLELCDRIMVLRDGRFADAVMIRRDEEDGEFDTGPLRERIRKAMIGEK